MTECSSSMRSSLRTFGRPVERYVKDVSDAALRDDPPLWAATGAALLAVVLIVVLVANLLLDPHPGPTGESARRGDPAAAPGAAPLDAAPPGAAVPTTATTGAGAGATTLPVPASGNLALADRNGVFQQVPQAAVEAARVHGASGLGLEVGHVRHHLLVASPDRYELSISSLDGQQVLEVTVSPGAGGWQAS